MLLMYIHDLYVYSVGAGCYGPMSQNEFLHRMGIRQRIEVSTKDLKQTACIFTVVVSDANERGILLSGSRSSKQL